MEQSLVRDFTVFYRSFLKVDILQMAIECRFLQRIEIGLIHRPFNRYGFYLVDLFTEHRP